MTDIANALALIANFLILPGLTYGCQLALGALGITLVYGILRFSNFAHGETMSFGAMACILVTWWLQAKGVSIAPLPTVLLALPAGFLVAAALCLLSDRWIYRFYRRNNAPAVIVMIASVGLMFFINGLVRFIIGPGDRTIGDGARFIFTAREFRTATGLSEGLALKTSQVITIVSALAIVAFLFWFLNRTRVGKSMRAYANNRNLALLSGINPDRVVSITWILVAVLATVAGTLYGLDKSYKPFVYMQLLLPIFAAAIVGGLGNPLGAIAGGFVVAFSELSITFAYRKFLTYLLPESGAPDGLAQLLSTDYKFAVSFAILVLVLLVRPTGIFRSSS